MALSPGVRFGAYEIVGPLGAGGMGEVYRATDTKLDRHVAVKVLPAHLSGDPVALARFEREAKAVAALSHPAILAIFDFGSADGIAYAVTELLEGETLRDRLVGGPLPVRRAVEYAVQIADGLGAAHEKGIVHRDLKPENLFVTNDGRVKILDFGLARQTIVLQADDTSSPTLSRHTEPGTVLGTVGYMSPEQVRGLPADQRSDVFSFGAVLYEMLSGHRAFKGDSAAETMHAILKDDPPDLLETNRNLPPALERIIRHCLEKRPEQRFHSVHDVAFDLQAVTASSGTTTSLAPLRAVRWKRAFGLGALLVAALALGALGERTLRRTQPAESPTYRRLTFDRGTPGAARFAPDGNTIVYNAAWRGEPSEVLTTRLDSRESRPLGLPGAILYAISSTSELAVGLGALGPAYAGTATLARVPLAGGAPREVLAGVEWADWSPDGSELAVVHRVGDAEAVEFPVGKVLYETKGQVSHLRVSPRGDWLAFLEHAVGAMHLSAGSVVAIDRTGVKRVMSEGWVDLFGLAWRPDGKEVWFTAARKGGDFKALYAATLDGKERLVSRMLGQIDLQDIGGGGRVLLTHPTIGTQLVALARGAARERDLTWLGLSMAADVSESGDLVLFTEEPEGAAEGGFVYLRKTDGSPAVRLGEGEALKLSPDGKWALARRTSPSRLVLLPTGVGEAKTLPGQGLTYLEGEGGWFPDSRRVVFVARSADGVRSYEQPLDGGEPKAIGPAGTRGTLVSPDARTLLARGPNGFVLVPIEGGEPRKCAGLESEDWPIRWSTNGSSIYVARVQPITTQVFRVELASGRRTLLWELGARDPAGATSPVVSVTPDGKAYVCSFDINIGNLHLVDGLK